MTLFSYSQEPFQSLLRLQEDLERVFEQPQGWWWDLGPSARGVFPPLNVFSRPDGCVIRLELPGLAPEDITLESHGSTLVIRGKRDTSTADKGSGHRRERWSGEFSRSLQLPKDHDLSKAEAAYRNGILTIEVPKREEARARQITVQAS